MPVRSSRKTLLALDHITQTAHLSTLEYGALMRLVSYYRVHGSLPDGDVRLARIADLTPRCWQRVAPILYGFFRDGWVHADVEAELQAEREQRAKAARWKAWARERKQVAELASQRLFQTLDQHGSADSQRTRS